MPSLAVPPRPRGSVEQQRHSDDTAATASCCRTTSDRLPDPWVLGRETGTRSTGIPPTQPHWARGLCSTPFVGQKLRTFVGKVHARNLLVLNENIESGRITPIVGRTYALGDTPDAIRDLETGRTQGRIITTV